MATEEDKESFVFRDKRHRHDEDDDTGQEESGEDASSNEPESSQKQPSEPVPEPEPEPEPVEQPEATDGEPGAEAPPIDFSTFVLSMASNAMYHMGGFQDPVSGKTSINLDLAKQTIDILIMLEDKSKGNLTGEEEALIRHSLYDLRMKFVELNKKDA
jgi:hypothetical protein